MRYPGQTKHAFSGVSVILLLWQVLSWEASEDLFYPTYTDIKRFYHVHLNSAVTKVY